MLVYVLSEVLWPEYLSNLGLALPFRPVFLVKFHESHRSLDCLLLRFHLELRIAADNFFGLREGAIGYSEPAFGKPDASALGYGGEASVAEHRAVFDRLISKYGNGIHELLGRRARVLGVLD